MIHKNMWYISMVDLCVHSSNFGGTFMFTVFINFHVTLADFYPSYNPNIENIIHVTEFFCWVMGGWGYFLSFQAAPYWWRPITNFGFAKSKIPFHIFPPQSLFRHFKHVYGLIFKHESVSQEYLQDFEMKLKSLLTRSFATKLTGHCIW